jgi:uncharacterized protein RhaS with RHS repeats
MAYEYYESNPKQVKCVREQNIDLIMGKELNFEYNSNETVITDFNGRSSVYQFNKYNNTKSVIDPAGKVQMFDYLRGSNINNKLSLASKEQSTIINYLKKVAQELE